MRSPPCSLACMQIYSIIYATQIAWHSLHRSQHNAALHSYTVRSKSLRLLLRKIRLFFFFNFEKSTFRKTKPIFNFLKIMHKFTQIRCRFRQQDDRICSNAEHWNPFWPESETAFQINKHTLKSDSTLHLTFLLVISLAINSSAYAKVAVCQTSLYDPVCFFLFKCKCVTGRYLERKPWIQGKGNGYKDRLYCHLYISKEYLQSIKIIVHILETLLFVANFVELLSLCTKKKQRKKQRNRIHSVRFQACFRHEWRICRTFLVSPITWLGEIFLLSEVLD